MEKRLENLEMLSMEQEHTIEKLNREVHRQQLLIQALELKIELLTTRVESIDTREELIKPEEDETPPPHY